ncbi:MAG: hypothetical protein QOG96_5328 [Pseudonocardiales bacterium]|nr:hypothetical protein [Pseudonocardiales bacterium]
MWARAGAKSGQVVAGSSQYRRAVNGSLTDARNMMEIGNRVRLADVVSAGHDAS